MLGSIDDNPRDVSNIDIAVEGARDSGLVKRLAEVDGRSDGVCQPDLVCRLGDQKRGASDEAVSLG